MKNLLAIQEMIYRYAAQAVAEVEARSVEFLVTEGQKWLSQEKRQLAVDKVMELYQRGTANIPFLKDSAVDDEWIRRKAEQAVDEVCEWMLLKLNPLGTLPVNNAPELGGARIEDPQDGAK